MAFHAIWRPEMPSHKIGGLFNMGVYAQGSGNLTPQANLSVGNPSSLNNTINNLAGSNTSGLSALGAFKEAVSSSAKSDFLSLGNNVSAVAGAVGSAAGAFKDKVTGLFSGSGSNGAAAGSPAMDYYYGGGGSASSKKAVFDWLNADLAKHYGMNKATGYQEALSNTAYQRAVADLKAAGLNPVLAMGKVNPADTFFGSEASSGGGGAGFAAARGSGRSGSSGKALWQLAGSAIGAAGGALASKSVGGAYAGGALGGTIAKIAFDAFG